MWHDSYSPHRRRLHRWLKKNRIIPPYGVSQVNQLRFEKIKVFAVLREIVFCVSQKEALIITETNAGAARGLLRQHPVCTKTDPKKFPM